VVPRRRDRAESGLADEARRRSPAGLGSVDDAGELVDVEADDFGGRAALGHLSF
jgi:hypothetical protein